MSVMPLIVASVRKQYEEAIMDEGSESESTMNSRQSS